MKNPQNPEEWQEAVDAAEAMLLLDSARQYGLITGGPGVHVDRCLEVLAAGRDRGIVPRPDAIERVLFELMK